MKASRRFQRILASSMCAVLLRKEGRNKGFISFGPDPRDPKRLQLAYPRRF